MDFNERISRLSQLSWELNGLRSPDKILEFAVQEAPQLVSAVSCAIWLWDTDQQAPNLVFTDNGYQQVSKLPLTLLTKLREISKTACFYSMDAGESDQEWPAILQRCSVAFIPLMAQQGCLGIMSVHAQIADAFSLNDILFLSSFGNLVATSITNRQLSAHERHLVSLLQTSIRQVVQATSRRQSGLAEFVESLVHVTEGLTRADTVCAYLEVGAPNRPIFSNSGIASSFDEQMLRALSLAFLARQREASLPASGNFSQLTNLVPDMPATISESYAFTEIRVADKLIGIMLAIGSVMLSEEQQAFLTTMGSQISAGIESIEKTANIERMLFQLANINYVSDAITSTFDPSRIMSIISLATSQALNVPIVLCGWLREDGTIYIYPDTTIGLGELANLDVELTDNNAVIRTVLNKGAAVSSNQLGTRAARAFPQLSYAAIRDWVCVPMLVKGNARGIILVADTEPRTFTARDNALVSTYANQAALAMENSLLYAQIERQLHQMEQLYRISRDFAASLDENTIIQSLSHVATEALQAPIAMVCIADAGTGVQRMIQSRGITICDSSLLRWDAGRGIVGTVYNQLAPLVSENLPADGRDVVLHQLAQEQQIVSALVVPMHLPGKVFGTLLVMTHVARTFTSADQQLLQAIATEAAAAIRNARIHAGATHTSDQLREVIHTISHNAVHLGTMFAGLFETLYAADSPVYAAERMRCRLMAVINILQQLSEETPDVINLQDSIVDSLVKRNITQVKGQPAVTHISGARLILPVWPAAMLNLLILEYLFNALEAAEEHSVPFSIKFHQLGHVDMLVEIEYASNGAGYQVGVNPVIIQTVRQSLVGDLTDAYDDGTHRIRFRFPRPSVR